jgi:very-short-patch-repair endonuclease
MSTAVRPARLCEELALEQWGLITKDQAVLLGMSPSAIQRRAQSGKWSRSHPGVYRLSTFPTSWEQALMAACLWGGPGTVASHRAAAQLLGVGIEHAPVEVWLPPHTRPRNGIVSHCTNRLERCDVTRIQGIPVTTAARTLIDLGAVCKQRVVEAALEAALRERLVTIWKLIERLDEVGCRGRRGTATIRRVLRQRDPRLAPTESELENMLWSLIRHAGLPLPVRQFVISDGDGVIGRVDFAYPSHKLVIEAQGARWHLMDHQKWHSDAERRTRLTLVGWRVLEVSWKDIVRTRRKVAERIRLALRSTAAA